MNTHQDHTATCLCCSHLYSCDAEPAWSEVTPGSDMVLSCMKDHFESDRGYNISHLLTVMHDIALNCKDFLGR
jgi:alpha-mannosidase